MKFIYLLVGLLVAETTCFNAPTLISNLNKAHGKTEGTREDFGGA